MLDIPESAAEVEARSKADVQRELNQSNPFLKNSWLGAIVTAAANRIFDFYLQLKAAIRENFPDTATTGDTGLLVRWAAIWGIQLQAATKSNGNVVATGVATSVIPISTVMTVSDVGNFISTAAATISAQVVNVVDFTRAGQTATAKFASAHNLANGVSVTHAGASNTEYNGAFIITVTADDEYEFTVIGSPPDEIGTSATTSFTTASVPVQSEDFETEIVTVNLDAGTKLTLQSPIIGVDDTLTVDFGAVGGGTAQESDDSLRARMLDRIQNPVAQFNVAAIIEKAKEIAGVTRVFVQEVTPAIGQVTVFFMRDNDVNPIPTGSEVTTVKNNILTIKPANTADADVIVLAPTGVTTDYTFTALSPNTSTMQDAITASLRQFYDERTAVGVNIDEDAYRSAIFNTVDTVTGDVVSTFTLSAPVGDIAIAAGEIGVLGNVVYP
jgi:uncharacterized phage protein gp47/JayE